jgi:2-oxo-3-hexenedioate decarboxylase/2-keto-4-pentenoate hydratase
VLEAAGQGSCSGHKIGCTTPVMQAYLGIDHPCAGEVFAATVFESGAQVPLQRFHRAGVECEIAARLGADLPARDGGHDRDSVAAAVETLMAGIELVDDRYRDYTALPVPVLIADDFFNAGVVLGTPVTDWRGLDLAAIEGVMTIDGEEAGRGIGADILGHPFNALAWLADHRAAVGTPLRAGEFVMLGSVVKTVWIERASTVAISFEGLGEASVTLA